MKRIYLTTLPVLLACLFLPAMIIAAITDGHDDGKLAGQYIHHEISAVVQPSERHIEVIDRITIPGSVSTGPIEFLLYEGFEPILRSGRASLVLVEEGIPGADGGMDREEYTAEGLIRQNRYRIEFSGKPGKDFSITLAYGGEIYFPVEETGREYARGFSQTPGLVSEEGVYLAGSTFWVPEFEKGLITFDMTVTLPEGWSCVSQGSRVSVSMWSSPEPMEEIFLIAAQFSEYAIKAGDVDVMAFLRTPDEALANKYLETTGQYIEMYRSIIGEYPFSKFALVENFWETGYGMPSFTLLGEKVIRFPFILHSSYPHELLHNYWGNSVYVDFESGNWCEGITAYMADHLIKEQRGQGDEYRRDALRRYSDYVREGNDFPLSEFISRHDAASEAVGYGKSMMMWHMLRRQLGDEAFIKGVRDFYADNIFREASFDDLRRSFEPAGGKGLASFFRQWVERTGAPGLRLVEVKAGPSGGSPGLGGGHGGFIMDITVEQVQEEEPYTLELPLAVSFADSIVVRDLVMYGRYERFTLKFRDLPLHVQLDPNFDIFRRLDPAEIPPSLSGAFGAEKITIVLPSTGGSAGRPGRADQLALLEAYRDIAAGWAEDEAIDAEIVMDDEVGPLPGDRVVWVFGRTNRLRKYIEEGLEGRKALISDGAVELGNSRLEWTDNSIIVAVRHPGDPASVMAWLTLGSPEAAPGLARKLPHYGKYGYLAFTGDEPDNIVKGQWEAIASPMASYVDSEKTFGEISYAGLDRLPRREPLAMLAPLFSQDRMKKDIEYLSSDELEGRGPGSAGIEKAAEYIAERFAEAGLSPGGDGGTFFQRWEDTAGADGRTVTLTNVIGILPGSGEEAASSPDEKNSSPSVVLCAHYDHLGTGWPDVHAGDEGKIHPGADDNASGVSVMIELARHFARNAKPSRSMIFAAFTAEESGLRGSKHFIETMKNHTSGTGSPVFPVSGCIGAVNLDTVGRLGGRKVLILGASSAREWRFIFIGGSYVTGVESEVVTQDIDASDNVSFVEAGIPAVQLFAGPHEDYHRPTDTVEKIDAEGLVKVAALAREALLYLSERQEPLDFSGTVPAAAGHPGAASESGTGNTGGHPGGTDGGRPGGGGFTAKRVGTGCMPDFAFSGKGVRVGSVSKDSPASEAGIEPGDVIVRIGDYDVTGLKEYSAALKNFKPGDETTIVVVRSGEKLEKTIVLKER